MINFTLRTCEIPFKSLNIHCCCCKKGVLQSFSLHWDDQHVLGCVGGCAWGKSQIGSPPRTDFFQRFLSLGARAGGTPVARFSQGQLCIRDGVSILFPKWGVLPSHSLWARSALLSLAQGRSWSRSDWVLRKSSVCLCPCVLSGKIFILHSAGSFYYFAICHQERASWPALFISRRSNDFHLWSEQPCPLKEEGCRRGNLGKSSITGAIWIVVVRLGSWPCFSSALENRPWNRCI